MNICVYGAASAEINKSYIDKVEELGKIMAQRGHGLVFGGGDSGLMGACARGVYSEGGKITGVAPTFFNVDGILFKNCDEFIHTETMRERKQTMEDLSDAFIMTPGGIGTFEEFFEILTLKQLGRHKKPIVIFDIDGYFDPLIKMLDDATDKKFLTETCKTLFFVTDDPKDAIDYIEGYVPTEYNLIEVRRIKQ